MPGILTGGGDTVVAIRTVACCIGVIELYRQPVGLGDMAGIALRSRLDVVNRLPGRGGAVVTAGADTDRH